MTQLWRPLGRVLVAEAESEDHHAYASYPTPLPLPDGRVRVFYSPRDMYGRSVVFSVDLSLSPGGFERCGPALGPWLRPGPRGAFDDAGTSVGTVVPLADGGLECWYLGWTLGTSVPFRNFIGRAVAAPGEARFQRASPVPALDRAEEDPLSLGYPWVLAEGERRVMWYGTHLSWGEGWMEMRHAIRRAVSADAGRTWRRDAAPALLPQGGAEWALSRPCVLRDASGWHMWLARRLDSYGLGYAHSLDGLNWTRADAELQFTAPGRGWERGSRTYPAVFDHVGRRWMLYNGAGFGATGFGLAVLEEG